MIPHIAIGFAAGFFLGWLATYIWHRTRTIGVLKIVDHEGMSSVFLELEKEFREFRKRNRVTLRVENTSYYENQN